MMRRRSWRQLTEREQQFARALAEDGCPASEIARTVGCSEESLRRVFAGRFGAADATLYPRIGEARRRGHPSLSHRGRVMAAEGIRPILDDLTEARAAWRRMAQRQIDSLLTEPQPDDVEIAATFARVGVYCAAVADLGRIILQHTTATTATTKENDQS